MKGKLKISIIILMIGVLAIAGIFGYTYYKNEKIQESKEHFKKAEAFYAESKYDKAIKEYSKIHKWDEENYKVKSEKISICKTNQESLGYIDTAKKYEEELNYKKAIEMYQKVSEMDTTYYTVAQNSSDKLQKILDNADFVLKYTKSIEKKFGLKK